MFAYNSCPPDPAVVGERWREMWHERLTGSGLWLETWLRHQRRDSYWRHGSVCSEPEVLVPGKRYQVAVQLNGMAKALPPRSSAAIGDLYVLLAAGLATTRTGAPVGVHQEDLPAAAGAAQP